MLNATMWTDKRMFQRKPASLNHSFMTPGLVATSVAVVSGLTLARIVF